MAKYSEFPISEYERRYKDLVVSGRNDNIDAFVFTDEINIRYFAGGPLTDIWVCRNDFIVLIVSTDISKEPTLLLNRARSGASKTSWIEDKRFWKASIETPEKNEALRMILETIKEKRLGSSKIAMETGISEKLCMPIEIFEEIKANFPNMEIISTYDYIIACRELKSKLEIDALRSACQISTEAFEKGLSSIKEGITEKDISNIIKEEMFRLGAGSIPFLTVIAGWNGRSMCCDSHATDYEIKKGDIIQIDGGCSVKGYTADMVRTGALRYVKDDRYTELYEVTKSAQNAVRSCLRNGAKIKNVCLAGKNYFLSQGYGDLLTFGKGHTGHGIGLDLHESPFLLYDSDKDLKKGMVVAIEPAIMEKPSWEDSLYFTVVENNYVITSSGFEQLTNSSEDIRII